MKTFIAISLLILGLGSARGYSQSLNLSIVDTSNKTVSVDLDKLQVATLHSDPNLDVNVQDTDGNQVIVSQDAIGYAMTHQPGQIKIYTGKARLFGEQLTLSDISFSGEDTVHYVQMMPEGLGFTWPGSANFNQHVAANMCFVFHFNFLWAGTQWTATPAIQVTRYPEFSVIEMGWPDNFLGYRPALLTTDYKDKNGNTYIATEIRCNTHIVH